jgi:uncharacterized iron-regulated protein
MPRLQVGSILFPLLSACASTQQAPPEQPPAASARPEPPDPGPLAEKWMLPSRIMDGSSGQIVTEDQLIEELLDARAIYVGEKHHSPHDHSVQLWIVHALHQKDPSLAIGLEMVKRPFQASLDRYLTGEIDEETFLSEVEWEDRWGYPFFLYRPILRYAKEKRIPVYALNAKDEVTRKVAREGMSALDEIERASIPDLDLSNEQHKAQVREAFDGHHEGGHGEMDFDNFYAAQVIWDETMAYEVARVLRTSAPPNRIVVLAGGGHVRDGLGIPSRAAKRGATPHKTILPLLIKEEGPTLEEARAEPGADFVWLMSPE